MDNMAICRALFEAFEKSDDQSVRSLCSPDMQAWQNNNPPMGLDMLLGFLKSVLGVVKHFRYEEAKRSITGTGFVEEHRVRGTLPDGSQLDLAVCVIADVRDGQIYALREYLDTAAASGLIEALS